MISIDSQTNDIAKTLSAILSIVTDDESQTDISCLDVIETLRTISQVIKSCNISLPKNCFKHDPYLNRYYQYISKECTDVIVNTFPKNYSPFSAFVLIKNRILPQIISMSQKIDNPALLDTFMNHIILLSHEEDMSIQEARTFIMKTARNTRINRLALIAKTVDKVRVSNKVELY